MASGIASTAIEAWDANANSRSTDTTSIYVCYMYVYMRLQTCMGPLLTRVARVFRRLNLDFKVHCMSGKRMGIARAGSALESKHVE